MEGNGFICSLMVNTVIVVVCLICVLQVTDYTRDLEEMQNVSREEYLASLRRCVYLSPKYFLTCKPYRCLHETLYAGRAVAFQEDYQNIVDSPGVNASNCFYKITENVWQLTIFFIYIHSSEYVWVCV